MTTKKKPHRKCIGCGQVREKTELIRIVRTPEGIFQADVGGKMNGRGAYLCKDPECLKKAVKGHGIERSFHCRADEALYGQLEHLLG